MMSSGSRNSCSPRRQDVSYVWHMLPRAPGKDSRKFSENYLKYLVQVLQGLLNVYCLSEYLCTVSGVPVHCLRELVAQGPSSNI